jgi:hypothetical protein
MLPTVGHDDRPVVVSLSPHFVEIHKSLIGHFSRWSRMVGTSSRSAKSSPRENWPRRFAK